MERWGGVMWGAGLALCVASIFMPARLERFVFFVGAVMVTYAAGFAAGRSPQ